MEELFDVYGIDYNSPYYKMILNGKTGLADGVASYGHTVDADPDRAYRINSYGYRSEEFSENADILIVGCSHTFGTGLDEELRWGDVLAKKLNLTPQTLGIAGFSISLLVERIMIYCSMFGPPKQIACLFPDPFRHAIVIDSVILKSDAIVTGPNSGYEETPDYKRGLGIIYSWDEEYNNDVKFLKKPFNAGSIVSRDMALYQSIRSLRYLEKYCNDLGIPLVWGTWDYEFTNIVNAISDTPYKFDNFIDVQKAGKGYWHKKLVTPPKDIMFEEYSPSYQYCVVHHTYIECDCYTRCHEDYRELVGSDIFDRATDNFYGEEYRHFGAHVHLHFVEAFLSKLSPE